ncbi:methionine ABC transporter substrate-binding protein [Bacillus coahuilensis p1.1.43]|uniref:Lipoprotein n=1 Tax=Bacillus coahuilensis p1.1.43 TaxID=1150625 RepID=A0A147KCR7_9BACI|nr:MetQ/NlpA family ABC transporter substrate-binding protein [Bacillus coahuilensis]KUP09474.1 methionine ABC transporter substrate-binding protein [Bacillus coahuilensis p1.1.43]
MKKKWIWLLALISLLVTGCSEGATSESKVIKVGLNGSGVPIWEKIQEKAAEEGIEIELVEFADYVRPNMALADRDVDLNAFQTVSYFDAFIKEHSLDLAPIATTIIAPMGVYSEEYSNVADIPDGSTIALPSEETNLGRALLLLQSAGLITLPSDFDGNGDISAIEENLKNLTFETVVAAQTPRVLPDVAASVINNGVAVEAGFIPVQDAIFIEDDTAEPYINIIAARSDEVDNKVFQRIVEIYQQQDVANHINEVYNNSLIPTFVPLEQIGW